MAEDLLTKIERDKWELIKEVGRILNGLDDLKRMFPVNDMYGEIRRYDHTRSAYDGFVRPAKREDLVSKLVGYHCHHCEKTLLGMPEIKSKTNGFDAYCRSCNEIMYSSK